ncbi:MULTISPECIES: hypothetical protein [unclassified Streptomyces]|uniref:hypothetical protein n=1 Tax=unclassified Streptomyces TaxID=2593676 RepID=UPI0011B0D98C|nr:MULTISPECIES: hypothetical protein [unclassified Streptomyces]
MLPLALVVSVALTAFLHDTTAVLPSLYGGVEVVAVLFVPVPVVVALLACLDSRTDAAEVAGVRAVGALDAALAVAVTAVTGGFGFLLGALLGSTAPMTLGRDTAFLVGLMLCVRAVAGSAAAMAPVAWILIVIFFGFRQTRDPYPWTIIAEPIGAPHAAAGAALMSLAGLTALLCTARRLS